MDKDYIEAIRRLLSFCKTLQAENIAMSHVLKDDHRCNWRPSYKSYLEMAQQAVSADYRDVEQAIVSESDFRLALESFLKRHPEE